MKDLSVTQEYLLCVLGKRGSVSLDIFKIAGLAAGGVLELLMEDILTFDEKKLSIRTSLPWEKEYLRPIYELIQQKQPIKVEKIAEEFSCTLTNKRAKQLIESIGDSLEEAGYARKEISGIFGSKVRYFPDPQGMDAVVQKIRAEILEDRFLRRPLRWLRC